MPFKVYTICAIVSDEEFGKNIIAHEVQMPIQESR